MLTSNTVELYERARIFPIPETNSVVIGTAAEIENDAQNLGY